MKWKDVKKIIEAMTKKELDQDAIVINEDLSVSNAIQKIKKADCEMFLDPNADYPSPLLRKDEIEEDDIDMYEHYYSEGHFIGYF